MFRLCHRIGVVAALVVASSLFTGCQSTGSKTETAAAPGDDAVMCTKCQTVWVRKTNEAARAKGLSNAWVYTNQQKTVCPDCKDAVESFFTSGKLEHTCKTCGGEMIHCKHMASH